MAYLSPNVFIEEISSGIKPIQDVGTSTGAFVGIAERGPIGEAVAINNFTEFQKVFGGYIDEGFLAFAVKAYFDEGGISCYVVRVAHYVGSTLQAATASKPFSDGTIDTVLVSASSPGSWGNDIRIAVAVSGTTFSLTVFYKGAQVESFALLDVDPVSDNFHETRINGVSSYIVSADLGGSIPVVADELLENGADGLGTMSTTDFVGDPALNNGLLAFDKVDDINILAIPDAPGRDVHIGGMSYCESRKDCFYVADAQAEPESADDVIHYKLAQGEFAGGNAINSKYGALYTPWIYVLDPRTSGRIKIPPCGAIAGVYARTDATRGVHKAPAGIVDGKLNTALDVDVEFVDADQDKLNPRGINVIRKKKGFGNVVWGARTVSSDSEWRYLNVRRLFLFLEESIEESTKWTVFEPNDRKLWQSIVRNVTAFLKRQWLAGALVGDTMEQAFYVKCDDETNPQELIDLGQVTTEIGVAPSKPAEFVVFRIKQFAGGSDVSE